MRNASTKGILERLNDGIVIGAEGYVFELERRGYIKAGPYVPEVVLDVIKQLKLPAMVTLASVQHDQTRDGYDYVEACKRLADAGADIVGLNCDRGPETMLPIIQKIRQSVRCYVAAQPVPYKTTPS